MIYIAKLAKSVKIYHFGKEDDNRICPQQHDGQGHRTTREEVLHLDRWLHPGLPPNLPVPVDLQGGVRRVRRLHRPQEVLLDWNYFLSAISHRNYQNKHSHMVIILSRQGFS